MISRRAPKDFCGIPTVALAMFAAASTSSCVTANAAGDGLSERDIAVLTVVLQQRACQLADQKHQIVSDQPTLPTNIAVPQAWHSSAALTQELARRSKQETKWTHIDICPAVQIVDGSRVEAAFASDKRIPPGWDSFENAFPGAARLLGVSLPAFTSDGNGAVVYLDTKCGVLCGAGFYIELKRTDAGWQITQVETAWIS